ncbi:MAG: FAD-binding oxidoreductase [Pseudomonadota bacterium]
METFLDELATHVGPDHVIRSHSGRAAYDTDITGIVKAHVAAVVRPATTQDVARTLAAANREGIAVVPQGGNTGLAGGCAAPDGQPAILLNLGRMARIRDINTTARTATVDAGVILEHLNDMLAPEGLTFPMSFGAKGSAQIGGILSTNAGGSNAVRYGTARANCLGIEVVTASGEVMDLMNALRKDNTGYDLRDLIIGAEGTLGIITGAVLRLAPIPPAYATALVAMPTLGPALPILNALQDATGGAVEAFEYLPQQYFDWMSDALPDLAQPLATPGPANLMIEIAARDGEDDADVGATLENILAGAMERGEITDATLAQSVAQRRAIWAVREAAYEVSRSKGPVKEQDVSVPLDQVEAFLDKAGTIARGYVAEDQIFAVSHLGDGNVHFGIVADPLSPEADAFSTDIEALIAGMGGSISAEHGIGILKRSSLARAKDPAALATMRAIKDALDPNGILNPGKVL